MSYRRHFFRSYEGTKVSFILCIPVWLVGGRAAGGVDELANSEERRGDGTEATETRVTNTSL